tara:strand:- start:941 stop:1702 length:762 start_codon:yes stop_codon:yes gene_type:complete
MKNRFLATGLCAIGLLFGSCEDNITEGSTTTTTSTQENEIADGNIKHNLDIQVMSTSVTGKTNGLLDATVTISQNGNDIIVQVGASGIASFTNLAEGYISYYVEATGHASYNGSTYLEYDYDVDLDDTDAQLVQRRQLDVMLPRLTGAVKGSFYHEINNVDGYSTGPTTTEAFNYTITCRDIGYEPNVFTGTCDGNGKLDVTGLPEGIQLDISVYTVKNVTGYTVAYDQKFSYQDNFYILASQIMYLGLERVD